MIKLAIPIFALVVFPSIAAKAETVPVNVATPQKSATRARDIGGYVLGTHLSDVARTTPVEALGGDGFQTIRNGITYDFGVTQKGRIYRVQSSQQLGQFAVDDEFLAALAKKLSAKYGPPISSTGSTFNWELVEPVKRIGGVVMPFRTMWASAYVVSGLDGVSVHMTMIDFRLLWQDEIALNQKPRSKAARDIAF